MTQVTLDITGLGSRGQGLAQIDGATIAVPFTLPGERIVADVDDGRGAIVEIVVSSPERRPPACRHFAACGGCSVQHLSVEAYRDWKLSLLESALKRRGISGHEIGLLDDHGAGRQRVTFHVRSRDGQAAIGFMAARSHDLNRHRRLPGAGAATRRGASDRPPSCIAVHCHRSGLRPSADGHRDRTRL